MHVAPDGATVFVHGRWPFVPDVVSIHPAGVLIPGLQVECRRRRAVKLVQFAIPRIVGSWRSDGVNPSHIALQLVRHAANASSKATLMGAIRRANEVRHIAAFDASSNEETAVGPRPHHKAHRPRRNPQLGDCRRLFLIVLMQLQPTALSAGNSRNDTLHDRVMAP